MNPPTSCSHEALHPMLRESIDRFLQGHRSGSTDFSGFTSIFSRLLQSLPDPPLEIIWFYSATSYHSSKWPCCGAHQEQVSRVKELFQLLVSCSSSCNAVKRIAVLAPVLCELYSLVLDQKSSKKEVESLLEVIVSYISICTRKEFEEEDEAEVLSLCFSDMVRVWTVDNIKKDSRAFFPVVTDDIRSGICDGCGMGFLASVVMSEAFLLRLCLKFDVQILHSGVEINMHTWAVKTISGFRNFHFFGTLLSMLLDPVLPVTSLLKFKDETILREVLYDALIMVDYPFLISQEERNDRDKVLKSTAVLLLLVAENAMRFNRENGDNSKVNSYKDALSKSSLTCWLLKWVSCQTSLGKMTSIPTFTTPAAFIKWLLIVEDQGVCIYESNILKLHAKAVVCKSRIEYELPVFRLRGDNLNDDFIICQQNGGIEGNRIVDDDLEMVDSIDAGFMSCTHPVTFADDGTRKRKDGRQDESEMPVKFLKSHLQENIARCDAFFSSTDHGLSCMSGVCNPGLWECKLDMEQ